MSRAASRSQLWQPLGPDAVLRGNVRGAGRVAGRVNALAVQEDGERVYAASANGGVWYSGDGGAHWRALNDMEPTPAPGTIDRPAHALACGAIAVRFGSAAAPDTLIVGTGEPRHSYDSAVARQRDGAPGRPFGGVGMLIGTHDPASGSTSWTREAANLLGAGVYRIALEPGGTRIVAATSVGLYERPASGAEAAWTRVAGAPFATLDAACTDVLWTAGDGTVPPRLWTWVESGERAGLWMRASDDASASWQRIETPGATARRAVLASATPQQVWLLCDHPGSTTRGGTGSSGAANTPRAAMPAALPVSRDDCGCWFRSSNVVHQGFVRLIESGALVPVTYDLIEGRAIFEGDIDLGPEDGMAQLRAAVKAARHAPGAAPGGAPRGVVITGDRYRWPGGLVPWTTTGDLRSRVEAAIAHWESRTRIRFVERTAANSAFYPNWVSFESVSGCSSPAGMQGGGKQVVSLVDGCDFGATVHEIGHSLGLWHEQSREDRNAHVRIVDANIKPGKEHNFVQHVADGDDVGAYDYASIMHYPRDAFSKNGEDTIVPLGGQSIGQRDGLSTGDVAAIDSIYPQLVRPLLFRIAAGADAVARPVIDVPDVLGRSGHDSIAFAVHPLQHQHVVLGGSRWPWAGRTDDAALLACDVGVDGTGMLAVTQPLAPGMIGGGVHSGVHDIVYSNGGARIWVACDGGVYRSDRTESAVGFAASNGGLAASEANVVASHPVCEGHVVAGTQSHGLLARRDGAAWLREGDGQGGGIAFDPTQPTRFVHQIEFGRWRSSDDAFTLALPRGEDGEAHCAAHSMPALVAKQRPGAPEGQRSFTQTLIGTSRLWYSEDFGRHWVTLPGGSAPPAGNFSHDDFGRRILACRWQGSEVAWVLGEGRLRRYARAPGSDTATGPGTWTGATILERTVKPKKDETKANGPIRDAAFWTDIVLNLEPPPAPGEPPAARGTRGALYLGTIGKPGDAEVDTLWWFDGNEHWFATGLRGHGVPAPVTAIACDPDFPDEVYVGTTIGVWKGERDLTHPDAPTWTWSARLNGLPEAATQDLALYSRDGLRLLRAAIAAHGVWELRLDRDTVDDLAYLRAHDDDLRHRESASMLARDGSTLRSWHASPDVRPRHAPLAAPTPGTLPWTRALPGIDAELLRRFQSALRARRGDPRVRPTGEWDDAFERLVIDLGAPTFGMGTARIDKAFWEQSMQAPWATAEPWGRGVPSSADLLEFAMPLTQDALARASCTLPRDANKVEVLVQHRGLAPLNGADVRVTLLVWTDPQPRPTSDPDDVSTWPTDAVPWAVAVNELLNTGATSQSFAGGWRFAGSTPAKRSQTLAGQSIDALHPGIASFDLDLSAVADGRLVLLAAVIRAGNDIALSADTLENLVVGHAGVAARSLRVGGTSVAAPAARSPFPTVSYARELSASAAQNTRLTAALQSVRATLATNDQQRLDRTALIIAKLSPSGRIDYAGVHERDMYFSASLLKVSLLYASFELVAQVNALAPTLTATSSARFLQAVKNAFAPLIRPSVRRIPRGPWREVDFADALTATAIGGGQYRVTLSARHAADLGKIFSDQHDNNPPSRCMQRLGYSFVNRALEAAGFLDAVGGVGIWMATDYGGWSDFHVPVATASGGRPARQGSSSAAMTAIDMASLLAHMHRGQLIDAAASQAMRDLFAPGGAWSWFGQVPGASGLSFEVTGCKVGESGSGSAFVGTVLSEGAFLRRKSDDARFVVVWQNMDAQMALAPIYQVIDAMVRDWP